MKRKALGKGLGALIPERQAGPENKVQTVPLGQIKPGIQQPRTRFDTAKIRELSQSIKANGVIQPVVLRPVPTGYELIAGERRWRAARQAGLERIPAIIRQMDDQQALEISLIENLQRDDLNPMEAARGYKLLMQDYKLKQAEVARVIGKKRATIANSLRLLKLPDTIQEYLEEGILTTGHAKALLSLKSDKEMIQFAETVISYDWSVRHLEKTIRSYLEPKKEKETPIVRDPNLTAALDTLRNRYATRIKCIPQKNGGGKLVLEYYDEGDLIRIIDLLGG